MISRNTRTSEGSPGIPTPVNIMGVSVVPFETYDHALDCVDEAIAAKRKSFWVAINPIKVYNSWHQPELRDLLRRTDVGFCDGVGVSVASRILNGHHIKRITGCDLFFRLLVRAAQKQWRVYLLGASPESNAAARRRLQQTYPGLRIVGWKSGYFEDSEKVVEDINASKADVLFVAMGSPKQEEWLARYWKIIEASFCMGVGGSFDIASGRLRRAPKIFRLTGTEFLFRLALEPRKRLSNQKVLLSFLFQVLGRRLFGGTASTEWA